MIGAEEFADFRFGVNRVTLAVCWPLPGLPEQRTWRCTAPTDVMGVNPVLW